MAKQRGVRQSIACGFSHVRRSSPEATYTEQSTGAAAVKNLEEELCSLMTTLLISSHRTSLDDVASTHQFNLTFYTDRHTLIPVLYRIVHPLLLLWDTSIMVNQLYSIPYVRAPSPKMKPEALRSTSAPSQYQFQRRLKRPTQSEALLFLIRRVMLHSHL